MNLFGNLLPVPAPKYKYGLEEIDTNRCARVFRPPIHYKKAMDQMLFLPDHGEKVRRLPAEKRQIATHRIVQSIIPVTTTAETYCAVSRLLPLSYMGRDIDDPGYQWWAERKFANFKLKPKARIKIPIYKGSQKFGQPLSHPRCMLMCGKPGTGKTVGLQRILWKFYGLRRIEHEAADGAYTQIPYVYVECSNLGSALGLVKNIIRAICEIAGFDPADICENWGRGGVDDLFPQLVNLVVLFSVGVIFIDEAEALRSGQSGGNKALIGLWVRLVNESMASIVLISNPDIQEGMTKEFKALLRFSGGGTIRYENLALDSPDWMHYWGHLIKVQYTKNFTEPTPELMKAFYKRSKGLMKLMGYLMEWTQNLAIEEKGKELITEDLIDRAWRKNGGLVHKIVNGIPLTEEEQNGYSATLNGLANDLDCSWLFRDGLVPEDKKDPRSGIGEEEGAGENPQQPEDGADQPVVAEDSVVPSAPKKAKTTPSLPAKSFDFTRVATDEKYRNGRSPYETLVADGWMEHTDEFFPS